MEKKILITSCFVFLLLAVPFTGISSASDLNVSRPLTSLEGNYPEITMDLDEINEIKAFVSNIEDETIRNKADVIVNEVINSEKVVDLGKLGEAIESYMYKQIPEEKYTNAEMEELLIVLEEYWGVESKKYAEDPLIDTILFIIEKIRNRLGYISYLTHESIYLIRSGIRVLINVIILPGNVLDLSKDIIELICYLIASPLVVAKQLYDIWVGNTDEYEYVIINKINEIWDEIWDIIQDMQEVVRFAEDLNSFLSWLETEPWAREILVNGKVLLDGSPLESAIITCRDIKDETNAMGEFSFMVDSTAASDSIPANSQKGMHNCAITVEKDGVVLATSAKALSYVFADGEMYWVFQIKEKSKSLFENLFSNLFNFFKTLKINSLIFIDQLISNLKPSAC